MNELFSHKPIFEFSGSQQAPLVIQTAPIQTTSLQTIQQGQQGQNQQSGQQDHIV